MREFKTTIICDSCGSKERSTKILSIHETVPGYCVRDYCIGIDHGPMGAEKDYKSLDLCKRCKLTVPQDNREMSFDETLQLIKKIQAGEFVQKRRNNVNKKANEKTKKSSSRAGSRIKKATVVSYS